MRAVIMAGGKGTRLRPLTCNKPKPLVPIVNRPIMEHILYLLKKHRFEEVVVTLFYLGEAIENYFGDGREYGLKMHYVTEEKPLGTAGCVKNIEDQLDQTFLVISGDALTDFDLEAAVKFHKQKQATATIVLTKVNNPLEYGVVITEPESQRIKRFLEKPGWGEVFSDTVNTGIYILEPRIFSYIQPGVVFDFSKDLFPLLLAKGEPLYGYVASGYWSDIGNLDQYREAHFDALTGKVRVSIPGKEIKPGIWVGEGVEIDQTAVIKAPVLLGDYCRVKAGAHLDEYTVIGKYGIVQEDSSMKRSILWDHCYLGPNTELRGALLCHHSHLKGRNKLFEGAVLGEGVSMGVKAVLKPQVKVWPNKTIDSGTILTESLIWAKKGSKSLFGNAGISGTVNQEITPEIVAKLGAAFGAGLKQGARCVVSSDHLNASRVLKRALVAGLLASGTGVYDLGTMATPIARYALVALGAQGGVHLRIDPQDPEGVLLEFFDSQGMNIAKSTERALENRYFSEDFPRATAQNMGELTFVPQLVDSYLQGLINPELKKLIREAAFKIVVNYDPSSLAVILPGLFEELGCEVFNCYETDELALYRPKTLKDLLNSLNRVAEAVRARQADLGVLVDSSAERLILLDNRGELVKDEELTALLSFQVLKYQPEADAVPVQVTAPHSIEELAREFRGKVIRTKANPRSLMEQIVQTRLFPTDAGQTSYLPQVDALFSLIKILELLAREAVSLAEARQLIPRVERSYQEVDCPWEAKGRIMRNLFEENKGRELELTDGLKVFHDAGWTLVLPDAEEPVFRIYAEANTAEEADALARMYMDRINQLQLEN
ncbi:MAG TPA: mannose-1-phosphate guanyltransferase [Bacillota bacterium]